MGTVTFVLRIIIVVQHADDGNQYHYLTDEVRQWQFTDWRVHDQTITRTIYEKVSAMDQRFQ